MRRARVLVHDRPAGLLEELEPGRSYRFTHDAGYAGPPVSLTMPVAQREFSYATFPPFFDGLLPEGFLLESLLRQRKLDRNDNFGQLLAVGADMLGAVTVEPEG